MALEKIAKLTREPIRVAGEMAWNMAAIQEIADEALTACREDEQRAAPSQGLQGLGSLRDSGVISPSAPVGGAGVAATPSDGDFAQVILRPLAFRMACREGVGEGLRIGEGLRRELELALSEAAHRLEPRESA